jgi:hypothetical protein
MNKPIILCGAYGAPSAIDLPIDEMVDRISQSKFTGYSVFATAPAVMKGAGKNMHQFTFNKATGQFNMKNAAIRKNNRFYDRIQEMAEKFAENKIDLLFKFFTQYYQDKYVGNHKWKKNPFRNNDAGIRWGKPDSFVGRKELYDSWIKNTHSSDGSEYHWLKWKPINESQLKWNFSPVGIIGEALCEYIEETVRSLWRHTKAAVLVCSGPLTTSNTQYGTTQRRRRSVGCHVEIGLRFTPTFLNASKQMALSRTARPFSQL